MLSKTTSVRKWAESHRLAVAVFAAVAIVSVLLGWLNGGDRDDGASSSELVRVEPRAFTSTVVAVGAVKPQIGAEVRVGSRISGRVRRLRANIGDRVTKGQVIAELETAELDALIAQRQAELRLRNAKLDALERLSPEAFARAESDVKRFEATAKLAADESNRQQALLRQELTTPAQAEMAEERKVVAREQLESARRARALVGMGNIEQREQDRAEHARAVAGLRSAMVDRSFTVLTAPISGIVASVATQEGETVAAGLNAPTFLTIVDLERLQVDAYVDEVDIGKVAVGQRATFTVDAFPARDFEGRVTAIYPSATIQDNVVKYVVAVHIGGTYIGLLRPEMTASVRIELPSRNVLAVPAAAIRRDRGQTLVHVWKDGRSEQRVVRVGWRDGPWAEIIAGVQAGDRILRNPPASGAQENK